MMLNRLHASWFSFRIEADSHEEPFEDRLRASEVA